MTIALLDTGVDLPHPYLRGKILPGSTSSTRDDDATRARRTRRIRRSSSGTAPSSPGILVGAGGPGGPARRRAGRDGAADSRRRLAAGADGKDLVYARSDQLIAGLDRAVDPNGDGDAHDAVRVALVGVAEPYAAFTDSPEARAVQGALDLNTLVVAPAGNDGGAGPAFGSVAGPGGRAGGARGRRDRLARATLPRVRVVLRRGLDVILDDAAAARLRRAAHALTLRVATPRSTRGLAGSVERRLLRPRGA